MSVDWLSERAPLVGVLQSLLHGASGVADGVRGYRGSGEIEGVHSVHPAAVLLTADEVLCGYANIVEVDRPRVGAALTHVLLLLAENYAGAVRVDDETAHSSVPCFFVGVC